MKKVFVAAFSFGLLACGLQSLCMEKKKRKTFAQLKDELSEAKGQHAKATKKLVVSLFTDVDLLEPEEPVEEALYANGPFLEDAIDAKGKVKEILEHFKQKEKQIEKNRREFEKRCIGEQPSEDHLSLDASGFMEMLEDQEE